MRWIMLWIGVGWVNIATALPATQAFHFVNRSMHDVYVWVVAAHHVSVPGAVRLPYLAVDIKPNTAARLLFTYFGTWTSNTGLTLAFTSANTPTCLGAMGQYSRFSITPVTLNRPDWEMVWTRSGIFFPYPIRDNVYEMERRKWIRTVDFPAILVFDEVKRQNKYTPKFLN